MVHQNSQGSNNFSLAEVWLSFFTPGTSLWRGLLYRVPLYMQQSWCYNAIYYNICQREIIFYSFSNCWSLLRPSEPSAIEVVGINKREVPNERFDWLAKMKCRVYSISRNIMLFCLSVSTKEQNLCYYDKSFYISLPGPVMETSKWF